VPLAPEGCADECEDLRIGVVERHDFKRRSKLQQRSSVLFCCAALRYPVLQFGERNGGELHVVRAERLDRLNNRVRLSVVDVNAGVGVEQIHYRLSWRHEMKTIGMIGGMSWESTALYYRRINELVRERLGGLHSAPIVLYSVDFQPIEALQRSGDWRRAGAELAAAAGAVERAGAELLLLCTNTMHKVAPEIEQAVSIPFLHIAGAAAAAIREAGLRRVGLLGTRFTMEQPFYAERLGARHGIEVIVPGEEDRTLVDRVIFEELCRGECNDASRAAYREVIARLEQRGAEGIVLGCTEITLLIKQADAELPLFDTTDLHAERAVELALSPDLSPGRA